MPKSRFGHIRRLGPDYYQAFWYEAGKKRSKRIRGSIDDAERFLASVQVGTRGAMPSTTLSDYWCLVVRPSCDGLETRTKQGYDALWAKRVGPILGNREVSTICREDVQRAIDAIEAPGTQRAAFRLLRKILNRAVSDGVAARNPCDRYIEFRTLRRTEKRLLRAAEVKPWLDSLSGCRYLPTILAELGAGLRVEEACALDWEDVAFAEHRGRKYCAVRVDKAIVTVKGGSEMKAPKTAMSQRVAVMGDPFASLMERLRAEGPIVATNGTRTQPATITRNFKLWCQRHEVEYIQPKNLRSTFATLHGEAGSPDSLVSLAMGHADGTTRGTHYQASTEAGMMAIADCLSDYLDGESTAIVPCLFSF